LFYMRLGVHHSRSVRGGEEKNSCPYRESNPRHLDHSQVRFKTERKEEGPLQAVLSSALQMKVRCESDDRELIAVPTEKSL
jgi:hypothetical protein